MKDTKLPTCKIELNVYFYHCSQNDDVIITGFLQGVPKNLLQSGAHKTPIRDTFT